MMGETYLGIIRSAEDSLGVQILAREYELTAMLFDMEQITPLDMIGHFSGSNTSFFKILKDLEAKDVICAEPNPSDGRSKLYRLSDGALKIVAEQWARYNALGPEQLYASGNPKEAIHKYTKTVQDGLKVKQFTCEAQILLYLNNSPGMANLNFHDLIDVSQAKFNMCLAKLRNQGHIYHVEDASDGRKKLYFISDQAKEALDNMGDRIFAWLDSWLDANSALLGTFLD